MLVDPVGFHQFPEDVFHGVHNFSAHSLMVALVAAADAPNAATHAVLANLTQIAYTNLSDRGVAILGSGQTGGVYEAELAELVLVSTGGGTGPFRYVVLYNDTPTSPADPLICYLDYGSDHTIAASDSFRIVFPSNTIQMEPAA